MTTLGIRLKIARIKKQLNQSQVVALLLKENVKITQSYLSKMENDVNEPDIRQLKALSKVYDVNPLNLIYSEKELIDLNKKNKDV